MERKVEKERGSERGERGGGGRDMASDREREGADSDVHREHSGGEEHERWTERAPHRGKGCVDSTGECSVTNRSLMTKAGAF
jgi:hypothetical protein